MVADARPRAILHSCTFVSFVVHAFCRNHQGHEGARRESGEAQALSLRRNSCSSMRYLKALRPLMKTTGTSSL